MFSFTMTQPKRRGKVLTLKAFQENLTFSHLKANRLNFAFLTSAAANTFTSFMHNICSKPVFKYLPVTNSHVHVRVTACVYIDPFV